MGAGGDVRHAAHALGESEGHDDFQRTTGKLPQSHIELIVGILMVQLLNLNCHTVRLFVQLAASCSQTNVSVWCIDIKVHLDTTVA